MMRSRGRTYDDDKMVRYIAEGLDDSEIARRLGVNGSTVWRIRHRQSRPDLQARVEDVINSYVREIYRQVIRNLQAVVDKQIEVGLSDQNETARKCRDFVIRMFLAEVPPPQQASEDPEPKGLFSRLGDLSPELMDRIIEELDLSRPNIDEGPAGGCL